MHPDHAAVKEILSYFVRNPQAVDSLEGIARWRLLDEVITRKVDETQTALDWLVHNGYLRETNTAGAGRVYSLNRDRLREACALLGIAGPGDSERGA